MSTQNTETVVSNDAVELLTCFYNGLDKAVYSVAEQIAAERPPQDGMNIIQFDDVKQAGEKVLAALRDLVGEGALDKIVAESIQTCFDEKTCSP